MKKLSMFLTVCMLVALPFGNVQAEEEVHDFGVFETPEGSDEPGPVEPGMSYTVDFSLEQGQLFSFVTMLAESNDWFLSSHEGIDVHSLLGEGQDQVEITDKIHIYDAGTEANQTLGEGDNQAPRQSEPNTGPEDSDDHVRMIDETIDQSVSDIATFTIEKGEEEGSYSLIIEVKENSVSALSPGVWLTFSDQNPLYSLNEPAKENGLEALAEDGDPSKLISWLEGL